MYKVQEKFVLQSGRNGLRSNFVTIVVCDRSFATWGPTLVYAMLDAMLDTIMDAMVDSSDWTPWYS